MITLEESTTFDRETQNKIGELASHVEDTWLTLLEPSTKNASFTWEEQCGYAANDFMAHVENLYKQIEKDLLKGVYKRRK